MQKKFSLLILFVFSLVGCAGGIQVAEPGPFSVKGAYQVSLGKPWTAFPFSSRTNLQGLTIDGVGLNSLTFGVNIEDGDALIYSSDPKKLIPRFRKDMSESEMVEFVRDTLAYSGMKNLEAENITADQFGTAAGVRFNISGDTERGLAMAGMGKAAIMNDR